MTAAGSGLLGGVYCGRAHAAPGLGSGRHLTPKALIPSGQSLPVILRRGRTTFLPVAPSAGEAWHRPVALWHPAWCRGEGEDGRVHKLSGQLAALPPTLEGCLEEASSFGTCSASENPAAQACPGSSVCAKGQGRGELAVGQRHQKVGWGLWVHHQTQRVQKE